MSLATFNLHSAFVKCGFVAFTYTQHCIMMTAAQYDLASGSHPSLNTAPNDASRVLISDGSTEHPSKPILYCTTILNIIAVLKETYTSLFLRHFQQNFL